MREFKGRVVDCVAETATFCFVVVFLFSLQGPVNSQVLPTQAYSHSVLLDAPDVYKLFWTYDSDVVTFEVHAKTLGWVGLGLSRTGQMLGADIVIGWVKDGNVCFQDYHGAQDNAMPIVDQSQDWISLTTKEQAGYTILKMQRKLITCDDDDIPITDDTIQVIYGYHNTEPSDCAATPSYHQNFRGSRAVHLLNNSPSPPPFPSNVRLITLQNSVPVPSVASSYQCMAMELPKLNSRHHVVKIEPHVNETDRGLLRHVIVYACTDDIPRRLLKQKYDCLSPLNGVPPCVDVLFLWNVGTSHYVYPENTGFPLGGNKSPKFIIFEKHFHNQKRHNNAQDSSGLKLTITSSLRRFDAGLLKVGHEYSSNQKETQILPPGVASFSNFGYCVRQCLSQGVPDGGIKLIAVAFNAHSLAKSVRLRHIREGAEQPVISADNFYDYRFPTTRYISEVNVLPTDDLVLECSYSTTTKTKVTLSGRGDQNEECLAYIHYYPKIDNLDNCLSSPTRESVMKSVGVTKIKEISRSPYYVGLTPSRFKDKSWLEILAMTDWTNNTNVQSLQRSVKNDKIKISCYRGGTHSYVDVDGSKLSPPSWTDRPPTTESPCSSTSAPTTSVTDKESGAASIFEETRIVRVTLAMSATLFRYNCWEI